jgi:hypothetical protein
MIRISAAVLALALAACDASPFAATAPMDDGADVGSLDGERGADTSMGVGGDTWQAVGAGTFWPCGIRPEIAVLEVCHVTSWEKSERSWIARLRKVGRMLNIEDGGESCHRRGGPNEFGTGKQTAHRWNDRDDLQVRAREGGRR